MKRDRLTLGVGMSVETGADTNGRWFVCYARNASIYTRNHAAVRSFLKLPQKTTSRENLDAWLANLDATSDAAPC